jgi:hypothetical protein
MVEGWKDGKVERWKGGKVEGWKGGRDKAIMTGSQLHYIQYNLKI